jgi:uncharacterized damage-inducible protein DinB
MGAAGPSPGAAAMLAHVVAAERLWLARLAGVTTPLPPWPGWEPEETRREAERVAADWKAFVGPLAPGDLARAVPFVTSKGDPGNGSVEAILLHVIAHSAYHRSRAAMALSLRSGREGALLPDEPDATPRGLVE